MKIHRTPPSVDAAEIRQMIREELPAALRLVFASAIEGKPSFYSTRRGQGPAGMSDERCKAMLPAVPGATKRGRWWIVSREAFDAFERAQVPTPAAPPVVPLAPKWTAGAALQRAGLRRVAQ